MAGKEKEASDPFALLVNAANAKSEELASTRDTNRLTPGSPEAKPYRETSERSAVEAARKQQESRNSSETAGWREAVRRDALEREALEREGMERDIMFRRAAATGGFQTAGKSAAGLYPRGGGALQEADYLQQLRLEALVQQRRQETLAQLALAQELEFGNDYHALLQAEQFRQAAMLRQHEELLLATNGIGLEQLIAAGYGGYYGYIPESKILEKETFLEEQLRKERYEEQQRLANLSFGPAAAEGGPSSVSSANIQAMTRGQSSPYPSAFPRNQIQQQLLGGLEGTSSSMFETRPSKGTMLVPCPARGMPPDHVPETAYFKISEDIQHGADLVCSYYACRNSGAQFRFCAYCNLPVSKWNFAKLHKHEEEQGLAGSKHVLEGDNTRREPNVSNPGKPKSAIIDASHVLTKLAESGAKEVQVPKTDKEAKSSPKRTSKGAMKQFLIARQREWDRLLAVRPKDEESVIAWARQVLAVSDIDSFSYEKRPKAPKGTKKAVDRSQKVVKVHDQGLETKNSKGKADETLGADEKTMPKNESPKQSTPKNEFPIEDNQDRSALGGDVNTETSEDALHKQAATPTHEQIEALQGTLVASGADANSDCPSANAVSAGAQENAKTTEETALVAEKDEDMNDDDDDSTSSEESVDLRATKKLKTS